MGTGDWNDGMNRVGAERQRRKRLARLVSAYRAWEFAKIADARGELNALKPGGFTSAR